MLRCLLAASLLLACAATAQAAVTVHLAGDSTMAEKRPEKRPETGWGEYLAEQFRDGTVVIDNRAKNGGAVGFFAQYPGQALTIVNSEFRDNVATPLSVITGSQNAGGAGFISK